MRLGTVFVFLLNFLISFQLAAAQAPLLRTLEENFFYDFEHQRFGIEVEYKGVSLEKSAKIAQSIIGGQIIRSKTDQGLDIIIIEKSRIGNLKIKVETNQTGDRISPESEWVYEIVGPPLYFHENTLLQKIISELKNNGATGSENGTPVSIQTNTEMGFDNEFYSDSKLETDLEFEFTVMRNFFLNYEQIMSELSPVENRLKYIQPPSPKMLEKMKDPNYKPSAKQILNDYVYRQSLELLGDTQAWNLHIQEVKKRLAKNDYPIVKRVVKLTSYRFSSLLMYVFPEDTYMIKYRERGWTFKAPITEQRARNNDFDILSAIKQIIGLKNATKLYGLFKFNSSNGEFVSLGTEAPVCFMLFNM